LPNYVTWRLGPYHCGLHRFVSILLVGELYDLVIRFGRFFRFGRQGRSLGKTPSHSIWWRGRWLWSNSVICLILKWIINAT